MKPKVTAQMTVGGWYLATARLIHRPVSSVRRITCHSSIMMDLSCSIRLFLRFLIHARVCLTELFTIGGIASTYTYTDVFTYQSFCAVDLAKSSRLPLSHIRRPIQLRPQLLPSFLPRVEELMNRDRKPKHTEETPQCCWLSSTHTLLPSDVLTHEGNTITASGPFLFLPCIAGVK